MRRFIDETGKTFGKLKVAWPSGTGHDGAIHWLCFCECGAHRSVSGPELRSGRVDRCKWEQLSVGHTRHGHSPSGKRPSPEYRTWCAMRTRCANPNNDRWHQYGGRGIRVCERWELFENFLADMGPKPTPKHSIDRWPNNDGNYEPGNCRWATNAQQNAHRIRDGKGRYI